MTFTQLSTVELIIILIGIFIASIAIWTIRRLIKISFTQFFLGLFGLLLGLLIGYLVSIPIRTLPDQYGRWVPILVNLAVSIGVFYLFIAQSQRLVSFVKHNIAKRFGWDVISHKDGIVLDTSVLIDARIIKLVDTKFIFLDLIVPRFVLLELQKIADSSDPSKRLKGRRGLDTLTELLKKKNIKTEIADIVEIKGVVDQQLVKFAKKNRMWLMTLDYNLLQVAKIQKVKVLNINDLVLALKPILIPGDIFSIKIIQQGKEVNQGVGYLPDGTMVVVEKGSNLIGQTVDVKVSRLFQATSGQVIFVELDGTKKYNKKSIFN